MEKDHGVTSCHSVLLAAIIASPAAVFPTLLAQSVSALRSLTERIRSASHLLAAAMSALRQRSKVKDVGRRVAPVRSVLSAGLMASMALRWAAEPRKPASQSVTEVKLAPVVVTA